MEDRHAYRWLTKVAWNLSRERLEISKPVEVARNKAAKPTERTVLFRDSPQL